jgi:VCBS repeat-containing protein
LIPDSLRSLLRTHSGGRALALETYEDRLLYSAAPGPAPAPEAIQTIAIEPVIEPQPDAVVEESPDAETTGVREQPDASQLGALDLIVVDRAIPDAETLIARLTAVQSDPDRVLVLDSQRDGLEQIADRLERLGQTRAIHILSHGDEAGLRLGSNWLSGDTLAYRVGTLASWQPFLAADADVLFYGCDLAANETGRQFLRAFGQLAGTDVAASTDATGTALLGGDWDLEFQVGSLETPSLSQQFSLFDWNGLLATNTYQEGVSSYSGTQDSAVSVTSPGTAYGSSTTVIVGGTGERTGLIRFDNLFGSGPNQIPLGSTILSASLRLNVTTATSADASIAFHQVLENWSESSTYNSLRSGLSLDDAEVSSVADAIVDAPASTGNQLISGLEGSLQAWSDGATNLGWAISGNNVTDWAFSSSEDATAALRPMLLVSYTPPAPPTVQLRTIGETRVNAVTTDVQTTLVDGRNAHGTIGIDANGNYVVVWTSSNSDGSGTGVYAQRYNARGVALGLPIRANTTTAGDQKWSTIAVKPDGGFIVTWTSATQDLSGNGTYVRIFDANGVGGSEIRVNTTTSGEQYASAVGVAADGSFVVTWRGNGPGDSTGICVQKFSAAGAKVGGEQQVNTTTADIQEDPSIAVGQDGQFMVVWDDGVGTHGRRYGAAGSALDATQILIHADVTSGNPDVATNGTGDYHIVWRTTGGGDGSGSGLWRLSLGAADTTVGLPQQVTTNTVNDQTDPAISSDGNGDFIITWQGSGPGDTDGVFARKFLSDGTAVGTEFRLNETTAGAQVGASTALVNLDNYVAVWSGQGPGDSTGVFARSTGTLVTGDALLFTTFGNVNSSGVPSLANWTYDDILSLSDPNLTLGANATGTLSIAGNLSTYGDGNVFMESLDVIQHDVLVGSAGSTVQLYEGDVLFSVSGNETFGSLTVQNDDVVVFRPEIAGSFASGSFFVLFDGLENVDGGKIGYLADIDLIEQTTLIGDLLLQPGDVVLSDYSNSSTTLWVFHSTGVGTGTTTGSIKTLLLESEINLSREIVGVQVIERDAVIGGVQLQQGDLLVVVNQNTAIGTNSLPVTEHDIARLSMTATSANGPANVTASMLLAGSDLSLNTVNESIQTLAIQPAPGVPPVVRDETYDLIEGDIFRSQDSWQMTGWEFRTQLTFDNSSRTENLNDFPILVTLDTNRFDYSRAQASGNDLRFVDVDGTVLSYEIETWNPNGQSHIWVKVPQIDASSASDSIWLYYGNSGAAAGQNAADVWSNGYVGVWHMNGNPSGTQAIQDSSSSNVDGTSTGMDSTNQVNGPIGGALKFDGTSEYIRVATTSSDPTAVNPSQLTIEAWASSSGNTGFAERIINRRHIVLLSPVESYGLATSASDGTQLIHSTGSPDLVGTSGALPADRWRYVTGVLAGSTSSLYVDGVLNATQSGVTSYGSGNDDITIGAGEMGLTSTISQYWRGGIDEVRLSNVARSAAWTAAQYASMTDTMISYGKSQTVAGVLDNDSSTASGALTVTRVDLSNAADLPSVTLMDDGRLLADTGSAFESLSEGQTSTQQIQYTVMDALGNSDLATVTLVIHGRNDAPVLNPAAGPLHLNDIVEDATSNSGTTVADILNTAVGMLITDIDAGAKQGIAVTGANTTNGAWQYSLDGSTWSSLSTVSGTSATLLDVTARVRFVPNANFHGNAGAITFQAWDQSAGTNGQTGVDASINGGTTAFSSLSTTATITVTAVNDTPVLTTGPALTVLEGGQVTIRSASLNAIDVESPSSGLTYSVTGGLGFGHLERTTAPGTWITSFTHAEIDNNQIIYVHQGAENPSDYVFVTVTDGQASASGTLSFSITPVNDAPVFDAYRITLNEGGTVTLSTYNLLTNDEDTPATSLVYTVNSISNGRFELALVPGTAITSFTQDDVNNSRVQFVHYGGELAPVASLTVTDGTTPAGPRSMLVTFTNVNDSPIIATNAGLLLNEGATATISSTKLSVTDADNSAAQLTFTVTAFPARGRLERTSSPGVGISSFTQSEINSGAIRYVHDGSQTTADAFSFAVSDGRQQATGSFSVTVNSVNNPPVLVNNTGLTLQEGGTATIGDPQLKFSDADSSPSQLVYTVSTSTSSGRLERSSHPSVPVTSFTQQDLGSGLIRYVHDGGESTSDSFVFSLSDGSSTVTGTFAIVITPVNDPPALTTASFTITEGQTITLSSANLAAADPDHSTVTFQVSGLTHVQFLNTATNTTVTSFTNVDIAAGRIRLTHDGSQSAPTITVQVTDGALTTSPVNATVNFTAVNDLPTIVVNFGGTVAENGVLAVNSGLLSASDEEQAASQLIYTIIAAPADGRLERVGAPGVSITSFTQTDLNGGQLRYVHLGSEVATDSFQFSLSDGITTLAGQFNLSISPVNDTPVLSLGQIVITRGGTTTVTAASIDASDPDSAVLTFTVSNLTHGRFVQIATGVTVTSFTQAQIAAGEIGFTHDGGPTAPSASIQASDGMVTTAGQSVLFDFRYLNTPPSIANQTFTLLENATTGAVVGQVIANDPDPLELLSYSISGGPSRSLFTINSSTGQLVVASGAVLDFESQPSHTLTVQVQDRDRATATETVTVQLRNVNEAPVPLRFASVQGLEDGPALSIDLTRGFENPERSGLTFRVISISNPGLLQTATIDGAGQLVIQGNPNLFGATDLTIEATDGGGLTARNTLRVQLAAANDVPVAVGNSATVLSESELLISPTTLLSNDFDFDGDSLFVVLMSLPKHGTLSQNSDGTFTYRPAAGFTGADEFSYVVSDGTASSRPATVSLDVQLIATSGTGINSPSGGNDSIATPDSASLAGDAGGSSSGTSSGASSSSSDSTNTDSGTGGSSQSPFSGGNVANNSHKNDDNLVGASVSSQNDDAMAFAFIRKNADDSASGQRATKTSMDGDVRRDRNLAPRAFDSLTMGVAPATSADLAGSLASLQLTQLRMAFSSLANVAAFEQLASSLNAEMRSELAFEVPALAGASLTVGYVVWMLRGGMLITSLLAQMPAWRIIDPLVVLDSLDKEADDDESLGSLVEQGQSETGPA